MIIAVLVCVAIPSYNHSVINAHRLDGKIGLLQLAAQLEKGGGPVSTISSEGFYKLIIVEKKSDYFLIAATPIKSQLKDKTCGTLAMNNLGQKGILRSSQIISNKQCW